MPNLVVLLALGIRAYLPPHLVGVMSAPPHRYGPRHAPASSSGPKFMGPAARPAQAAEREPKDASIRSELARAQALAQEQEQGRRLRFFAGDDLSDEEAPAGGGGATSSTAPPTAVRRGGIRRVLPTHLRPLPAVCVRGNRARNR